MARLCVVPQTTLNFKTKIMSNEELKKQISDNQALHIANVMHCLRQDPDASEHHINYEETPEYLQELINKDGSLLSGLLSAIENYLEK
tara:strand:+ start:465 stop:728 length:264 start_codon:yes stop_codon:yes gene_type:complete